VAVNFHSRYQSPHSRLPPSLGLTAGDPREDEKDMTIAGAAAVGPSRGRRHLGESDQAYAPKKHIDGEL
jgi:hypothetical protein